MTHMDYVGGLTDIVGEDIGDEMGADDVGDDGVMGYDLVGQTRRRMMRRAQAARNFMPGALPAARAVRVPGLPPDVRVVDETPQIGRRQIAPIPQTTIAAGASVDVEFRPQRPIRVERLVLDGTTLVGVFLNDFLIGAEPQFVNAGSVPASTFAPTAFGVGLRGNTAQPGISVTLRFQNLGGAPVTIGGALLGTSLT
jgi:hypothetical protein